jgi:hypothetical protein
MLAYLEPKDLDARQDWATQHFEWHQTIYTTAVKKGFPRYDVYPQIVDMGELEGWAYFHNLEHQNITRSIFIGEPPDLSDLTDQDNDAWADWMSVHASIHSEIRKALGII